MKRIFITLSLLLLSSTVVAQFNYVSTIPRVNFYHVNLKNGGPKFLHWESGDVVITIFNYDGTVFKSISIPPPNVPYSSYYVYWISETLFDTDSTDIEYVQLIHGTGVGASNPDFVRIYDENSNLLFTKDSVSLGGSRIANDAALPISSSFQIYMVDTIAYMELQRQPYLNNEESFIYTIPGRLDNACCCDQGFATGGVTHGEGSERNYSLSSFPNPASQSVRVFYDLPEGISHGTLIFYDLHGNEVRRFEVSNLLSYILVSTENLPSGTYVYRIATLNGISDGKKQVVIR